MEYLIMLLTFVAIALAVFILEAVRARREEKKFIRKLYEEFGVLGKREYAPERFARMDSYFRRHPQDGQIDDVTWNDLGMDNIFKRMNYTLSATGEEYLYHTLRSLWQEKDALEHLEDVVKFFDSHPDERVQVQLAMRMLGYTGKYSLYEYLDNLDFLGERSNRQSIFRDLLFLPLIALLWYNVSIGVLGIVVLMVSNILTYFKEKNEIDPYIVSFAYVIRLLEACDRLQKISLPVCSREWEEMRAHRSALKSMRRNSFWVMSPGRGMTNASGNPIEILFDYVRMIFHVDLIKFNQMLAMLRGHREDIDALVGIAGFLETCVCILAFRKSLDTGYCLPEFVTETALSMEEGYHPLLEEPVKNSISAHRGVLITGSNASGKSTFLKTAAINAILAQTIHTCTARRYQSCFFHVYSSMALRDDIGNGESYYIVEIKALKRILDAAAAGKRPVLCFVDEVLRGTNTVERIAASTQILATLDASRILCFAATHDIELTELLEERFDNYHFEDDVQGGDVVFNYRLLPGRTTTRNAIKLLELLGYDSAIIDRANVQAEQFLKTGVWQGHLT